MSQLTDRLGELVRACFTGIWIKSLEPSEALLEFARLCREEDWQLLSWDIAQGLQIAGGSSAAGEGATGTASAGTVLADASDPVSAVKALMALSNDDSTKILVLKNYHRFLSSPEVIETIAKAVVQGKVSRTFVVVLSPIVQLPPELERLFVVIDHEQPTREELRQLLSGIATEPGEIPDGAGLDLVLDASAGLTRYEAENAFSLSLVRHGQVRAHAIWELKTQSLKKSGLLSLCRTGGDFSSLGGLTALKAFTKRALIRAGSAHGSAKPRGVLLLSPPGCGKSEFCKSLGNEIGRPVVTLDVGSLMGSLVGQSEERTRDALRIIDAMAPCVLMIDEIEKAFSGVGSGGSGDGGVSTRMFGTLLTWLNDHTSDVFVVCTANDVAKLPPEFSRAERFDGVFFVDLPGRLQKDAIWEMYREKFAIDTGEKIPSDDQWTGAEIRSCCRLSALLDVPLSQASQNVVPVAVTSGESVDRLRKWASGRCLDAELGGVYHAQAIGPDTGSSGATKTRRRVTRGNPELN